MSSFVDISKMVLEIAVIAAGIYLVLRFLREMGGSGVIRGLTLLLVVGVVAFFILIRVLELARLELVYERLAQVAMLGLIVVFQPEIRRSIVHLGDAPIFGRFLKREAKTMQRLLRSVARLSKDRIGALIAIERESSLASLAETGIHIDAELNSYLIESIFYPGSALHDGAIIVRDDRIVAASCLLPLSQNPDIDKRLGTRHRAGVGVSEETDALAIIVSEETGKVSVALGGKLSWDLSLEQLERAIEDALGLKQRYRR
jgi:diadenylate cyclase